MELGVSVHSFKALKGQIDKILRKLVRKLSFYYKFCNCVWYWIYVILHFPCRHHKNYWWPQHSPQIISQSKLGVFQLTGGLRKNYLTRERLQLAKIWKSRCSSPSCRGTFWHGLLGVQFILKLWMAYQMKALIQHYKIRMRIIGFKYLINEEFQFASPSTQRKLAVDRFIMSHLARHPELNLNLLIVVDSLNESPYQALIFILHTITFLSADYREKKAGRPKISSECVHS